jgi:hypothetical protein
MLSRLQTRADIKIAAVERRVDISGPLSVESLSGSDLLAAAEAGFLYTYHTDPSVYVLTKRQQHYVLALSEVGRKSTEFDDLARTLGLERGLSEYELDRIGALAADTENRTVRVETRSILGTLAYLSEAVQVPTVHVEDGLVTRDPEIEGALSDLLQVKVGNEAPAGMTLAVVHRGYWFYIDESDLSSKRTMGLLTSLMRLEIGTGGVQTVPILTLPITR